MRRADVNPVQVVKAIALAWRSKGIRPSDPGRAHRFIRAAGDKADPLDHAEAMDAIYDPPDDDDDEPGRAGNPGGGGASPGDPAVNVVERRRQAEHARKALGDGTVDPDGPDPFARPDDARDAPDATQPRPRTPVGPEAVEAARRVPAGG